MTWLFRIFGFVGGITFVGGGIDVATTQNCDSVTFGGTARSSTYTCFPGSDGEFSAGLAAAGLVTFGVLLLLFAVWPLPKLLVMGAANRGAGSAGVRTRELTDAARDATRQAEAMPLVRSAGEKQRAKDAVWSARPSSQAPTSAPGPVFGAPASTPSPVVGASDGWRADPTGRYEFRCWDGSGWTARVRSGDREFTDPVD